MYQWEGKNGDKMCTGVQSQMRRETPFYFGRDALPERKSCSGMCWDQGGSTPGAEVVAGSSEPMVLFAFFCQGLGSVSQNNQLCCPLFVATDTSCSKELSSHPSTILLEIYLGRKLVLSAEWLSVRKLVCFGFIFF